jgi:hypothetical protein
MVVISEPVIGPTELGATIANQFRSALAARGISLVSSTKLQQTENEEEISPAALRDRGTLACVASFAGATVIVDGTLQRSGDSLNLATAVLRAKNAKVFFRDNVDFDRTPELAELQKKLLPRPPIWEKWLYTPDLPALPDTAIYRPSFFDARARHSGSGCRHCSGR